MLHDDMDSPGPKSLLLLLEPTSFSSSICTTKVHDHLLNHRTSLFYLIKASFKFHVLLIWISLMVSYMKLYPTNMAYLLWVDLTFAYNKSSEWRFNAYIGCGRLTKVGSSRWWFKTTLVATEVHWATWVFINRKWWSTTHLSLTVSKMTFVTKRASFWGVDSVAKHAWPSVNGCTLVN